MEWRQKGGYVVRIGEGYEKIFMLVEGVCEGIDYHTDVRVFEGNAVFGEKELVNATKSEMTVRCKTEACFLVIRKG